MNRVLEGWRDGLRGEASFWAEGTVRAKALRGRVLSDGFEDEQKGQCGYKELSERGVVGGMR